MPLFWIYINIITFAKKENMELKKRNFRFNRRINLQEVINSSSFLYMDLEDINEDRVVCEEHLKDGKSLIVFQNTDEQYENERYCYIKLNNTHLIIILHITYKKYRHL